MKSYLVILHFKSTLFKYKEPCISSITATRQFDGKVFDDEE